MTVEPIPTSRPLAQPAAATAVLVVVMLAAWGSVGLAYYTQHVLEMLPCAWCVLQRLLFIVIGVLAAIGIAWSGRAVRVGAAWAIIGVSNLGMAAAVWQHFVAAQSASCNQTLADRVMAATGLDRMLPDLFAAYASCADASTSLLGVPYAFWSLALFLMLEFAGVMAWWISRRAVASD
ncbi:MAG: disulfide bond formation protein B [Aquabacterium sp.]|nr:disulfide bond formation protein B [Aquabacterium sp.]